VKEEGDYLRRKLSAETLAHENSIFVDKMTKTVVYTVHKHSFHSCCLSSSRERRERKEGFLFFLQLFIFFLPFGIFLKSS